MPIRSAHESQPNANYDFLYDPDTLTTNGRDSNPSRLDSREEARKPIGRTTSSNLKDLSDHSEPQIEENKEEMPSSIHFGTEQATQEIELEEYDVEEEYEEEEYGEEEYEDPDHLQ